MGTESQTELFTNGQVLLKPTRFDEDVVGRIVEIL